NEIIRDFMVQVEFDAKRSKKELADLEKLMKDSRKERDDSPASDVFEMELRRKKEVVEVFERLENDIWAFDRDLDEATRQLQWSDKRFDKHRNRLDQIAKRVEESRLPSVPFSMPGYSFSADLALRQLDWKIWQEESKGQSEEMDRRLKEMERQLKELERQIQE